MSRFFSILSKVWLALGVIVILFGYIATLFLYGWADFIRLLSPFNFINFLVVILVLSPGILFYWLSKKIKGGNIDSL